MLPATLLVYDDSTEHPVRLVDLSLGGARAHADFPVAEGAAITLALAAPQLWDPLEIEGTVAWVRPEADLTELGLRFEHRSGATTLALGELLEALLFA